MAVVSQECDAVHFFISSTSEPNIMTAATHSVINLHAWYPHVPPDDDTFHRETGHTPKHDNFNTIVQLGCTYATHVKIIRSRYSTSLYPKQPACVELAAPNIPLFALLNPLLWYPNRSDYTIHPDPYLIY